MYNQVLFKARLSRMRSSLLINFNYFQLWHLRCQQVTAAARAPAPPTSDLSTISTRPPQPAPTPPTPCQVTVRARWGQRGLPQPSETLIGATPPRPRLTEAACWGRVRDVIMTLRWPRVTSPRISPPPCRPPPQTPGQSPAPAPELVAQTVAPAVRAGARGDLQTLKVSPIILHQECHNPRLSLVSVNIIPAQNQDLHIYF